MLRLILNSVRLIWDIVFLRNSNGTALRKFASRMGLAYIKFAQMLAMQNINGLFSERDREDIMAICYNCNPISFKEVQRALIREYGSNKLHKDFKIIYRKPVGSASISQVHRAVLASGEEVVLKVKRDDVMSTVSKDVSIIRFVSYHFGWIVGIRNKVAINAALKYFTQWLSQETNFRHEVKNINRYKRFADSVNGKVNGCVNIVLPKVFNEYCTYNVICMEYVPYKTLFDIGVNSDYVTSAYNSYIKLSFYALLNNMPVVWHGDPHGSNIYIDDNGNIGFLDMGLVFAMSAKDAELTRKLFMYAYLGLHEKLSAMLKPYIKNRKDYRAFSDKIKEYCEDSQTRCISSFFMDVVYICFDFEIEPPRFLFEMAKAFVCLNGAERLYVDSVSGYDMLNEQINDYLVECFKSTVVKKLEACGDVIRDASSGSYNLSAIIYRNRDFIVRFIK